MYVRLPHFNTVQFLLHPVSILRLLQALCAVVVFGVLADHGKLHGTSVYNRDKATLDFAIGVAVTGFVLALTLFSLRLVNDVSSILVTRQRVLTYVDFFLSSVWTFLFFISFCWTTNKWANTAGRSALAKAHPQYANSAQAAIAFNFFSVIAWAATMVYGYKGIAAKRSEAYAAGAADPVADSSSAYAAFDDDAQYATH